MYFYYIYFVFNQQNQIIFLNKIAHPQLTYDDINYQQIWQWGFKVGYYRYKIKYEEIDKTMNELQEKYKITIQPKPLLNEWNTGKGIYFNITSPKKQENYKEIFNQVLKELKEKTKTINPIKSKKSRLTEEQVRKNSKRQY